MAGRGPHIALSFWALAAASGCELGSSLASAEVPQPSVSVAAGKSAVARPSGPSASAVDAPAVARVEPPRASAPTAVPAGQNAAGQPVGSAPLRFAGTGLEQDLILRQLARAQPLSFKPVGSTSTVFRMRLAGPADAAFKSVTTDRPFGPLAEVAAYRLARCLRLDNVPPVVSRSLPLSVIRDGLEPGERGAWSKIEPLLNAGADGMVHGAAIYWVPDLTSVGLENRGDDRIALSWLNARTPVPEERRELAGSISTMVAFDYLVGNFDRWSGGNVRGDTAGRRVYIRDQDHAFPARMRERLHRRLWRTVVQVERFSRAFYASLRALDRACFERELAADRDAREHLSERQILGVIDRRNALLSHIDALVAVRGKDRVLVFE